MKALLALLGLLWALGVGAAELRLRYTAPAPETADGWERQALPIGNGRVGAMLFGQPARERLQFNEITLWSGDDRQMGAYQPFGDLWVELDGGDAPVQDYERSLDLSDATHRVQYTQHGVHFTREAFASHPAGVIVLHLQADTPGRHSGRIRLGDRHGARLRAEAGVLRADGSLAGWVLPPEAGGQSGDTPSRNRLRYASRVAVQAQGGHLRVDGDSLVFEGCDALTLVLAAGTSYLADAARRFDSGRDPAPAVAARVAAALRQGLSALRSAHRRDIAALMGRVEIDLGATDAARRALPTDQRLHAHTADGADPELEALYLQYGRYLLTASSRDALPANLQGLWNHSLTPPWNSDYHSNINLQMNYWLAGPAHLLALQEPLLRFIEAQRPMYRRAVRERAADARAHPGLQRPGITPWGERFRTVEESFLRADGQPVRGWTVRTETSPFGAMGYLWNKTGNAWYALHFWEHFAFGQDRAFLRQRAYPLMKEVCLFWLDHLKTLPDGRLVAPMGWSPEHGPQEDGVSYDQQILWALFDATARAAGLLRQDTAFARRLRETRDRLAGPRIGRWGQLLEWLDEKNDPVLDTPQDTHRHVSHLFAVYPGWQISPIRTPALAAAARTSLQARGDAGTGWSMAWKMAFWARLHDGARAHRMLRGLLATPGARAAEQAGRFSEANNAGGTYDNLLDAHPPFQIDGNFGAVAAFCEMLLQSHEDEITLLPALPPAWPDGRVRGLRARGALGVDLAWRGGQLQSVTLQAERAGPVQLRWGERRLQLRLAAGERRTLSPEQFSTAP
ncbi:glycoside hydrolase family 95 protein [Ideonella sp. 4Y16]|uniref:glycoside hydrolase family 95 protein n=1 Tax=Ideonella alba TaxID=2824118 RepID=UPI001B359B32|nr:glycoside hydrolase family 95 protein [Ideonella alba]MBQ0942843.1 glycoside hydrolase family 95 protein [Ideonella alba]